MKDKVGFLGTASAFLCCLGLPTLVAPLSAIGLGFLFNDFLLLPLVFVFSLITLWGLHEGSKRHGSRRPFLLGVPVVVLFIPSFFVSMYLAALFLLLLLTATVWNTVATVRTQETPG